MQISLNTIWPWKQILSYYTQLYYSHCIHILYMDIHISNEQCWFIFVSIFIWFDQPAYLYLTSIFILIQSVIIFYGSYYVDMFYILYFNIIKTSLIWSYILTVMYYYLVKQSAHPHFSLFHCHPVVLCHMENWLEWLLLLVYMWLVQFIYLFVLCETRINKHFQIKSNQTCTICLA